MRLIIFGTYNTGAHPRVTVLCEGLRQHGHEVIECNVPLRFDTAARVAALRRGRGLASLAFQLARCWLALVRRWRPLPSADAVIVGYMGHLDVHLARLLFPGTPLVLDHLISASDTARDRGEHGRLKLAALSALDSAALTSADIIVVDTPEHQQLLPPRVLGRSVVVAVGADGSWFRAGKARRLEVPDPKANRTHPLKVVFFGLYTPLQGTVTIGAALAMLGESSVEVTMIGDGQDRPVAAAAARGSRAVRWLDWVPAHELPRIVAAHDVCLGIFGTTPKALRVVPNKVFQGAAAGCAVVTSDTHPQREMLGDAGVFVTPGDAGALAAVLRRLAADRRATTLYADKAARRARERFSPLAVVAPLTECLGVRAPRVPW
jgi:glycosyltransferase involved in cell wall biosynthesis